MNFKTTEKQAVLPAHFFYPSNSIALVRIVSSIVPLNSRAAKGKSPLIITADSPTSIEPDTLNPDILKLRSPVLPFQDSS